MKITKDILVEIEYKLYDEENNQLNQEEEELIYLHGGYGHVFEAFEDALEGKGVEDTFKITLTPQQAFGEYNEALRVRELLSDLPEEIAVGMELDATEDESQEPLIYVIQEIEDEYATLDANHPLAGITLTFEGRVVELQEMSEAEIKELLEHEAHEH